MPQPDFGALRDGRLTAIVQYRRRAKVEIALARGKKQYDKRDAMSDRDSKRDIARALKEHQSD